MSDRWETDILADLIAKKRDLLLELRGLTQRQAEVVQTGEMTELMSVLSGKQTLLGQIHRLEQGIDVFRHQDPDSRTWRSPEDRQRCRSHAEDCERMVAELVRIEKLCESTMLARRDALSNQLQSAGNAASARAAYAGEQRAASAGFDIQSEG